MKDYNKLLQHLSVVQEYLEPTSELKASLDEIEEVVNEKAKEDNFNLENLSVGRLLEADRILYLSELNQSEFNPINSLIHKMIQARLSFLFKDLLDGVDGYDILFYKQEKERDDQLSILRSHEGTTYAYNVDGAYLIVHIH
jgi:hypothetical protein